MERFKIVIATSMAVFSFTNSFLKPVKLNNLYTSLNELKKICN